MATTLDTIAKRLGVSRMAVSYALRGKPGVAEETRRKIQQVADELGYRPNAAARAIRRGSYGAVGLLFPAESDLPVFRPGALRAMQGELVSHHVYLTLVPIQDRLLDDCENLNSVLSDWPVDGLIVAAARRQPGPLRDVLLRHQIPAIWLNRRLECDCVYVDNAAAGRDAARRLIEMGHTRIAYAGFRCGSAANGWDDRLGGYRQAMNDAGLEPRFVPAEPSDVEGERQIEVARAHLGADDPPTAVVTCSTTEAAALMLAAAQLGRTVPGDLSILSIADDGEPVAGVPLTRVQMDHNRAAAAAAQLLLKKIKAPGEPRPVTAIEPIFHEGATCAAAVPV